MASILLALLLALCAGIGAARAETRVALVIGNGAYANTTALANPPSDARDVAAALQSAGFDVVEAIDADRRRLDGALRSFVDKLSSADVALFYYAGHGLQVGAQNYLVPVDARLERERDLEFEAVRLDFVLRQLEIDREGKTTIVILDACRDNPLSRNLARTMGTRSTAIGQGLAPAAAGLGTFIAYSTQPGNVALDGSGRNSPFTAALVRHMGVPGRNLPATMIEVRKEVVAATNGRQVPWDHSALTGDFYFVPGAARPAAGAVAAAPAGSATDVAALQERLKKLEEEARRREAAAPLGADAIKLAELRARAASLDELAKDLQRKLLNARMQEGRATDPNEKARLVRESMNIQMEWSRRGQDLRKLREEIAAIEGKVAAPASVAAAGPRFIVRQSNRIEGAILPAPPSTANCESRCDSESQCVGWNLSRDGICELYASVDKRVEDGKWRSGVRADVVSMSQAGPPPITPKPVVAKDSPDFDVVDNVGLLGVEIRSFRAPSPVACREACAQESTCAGFQHGRKLPMMGTCELFSRVDARREDAAWRSGLRKASAAGTVTSGPGLSWPVPVARSKQGFDFHEGTDFTGELIKDGTADSADGCMVVCRNTPDCAAALFAPATGASAMRCSVYSRVLAVGGRSSATAIVRAKP